MSRNSESFEDLKRRIEDGNENFDDVDDDDNDKNEESDEN